MLLGMDGSLDALLDVNPARVDHDGRLDLLIGLEQARAAIDAQAQQVLAALAREGDAEQRAKEWVREEVAAALRIAPVTAGARLHDATELIERLPRTLDRLVDGTLSLAHVRVLIEATRRLDERIATEVETRVLRRAGAQTVAQFRQAVRRAVLAADPTGAEQRHRDAVAERRVTHTPDEDGMAWIGAYLRADDAAHLYATVDALAAQLHDDRSADQKRADVLVGLADLAAAGIGTRWQGRRPGVEVSVALSTLLGLDDQPGELAGHGPIPAALARAIAADQSGTWRRLVTDSLGRLVNYGRTIYRPPPGYATICWPSTPPAPSPAAAAPPGVARPTTSSPSATAARHPGRTCTRPAPGTTTPATTAAGASPKPTTAR